MTKKFKVGDVIRDNDGVVPTLLVVGISVEHIIFLENGYVGKSAYITHDTWIEFGWRITR